MPAIEIKPKKNHNHTFKIISIGLPIIFFVIVEIILRLFNYGFNTSIIVNDKKNPEFCYLNPDLAKKYFTTDQLATTGNKDYFKKKKDKNTFRTFVLGESSALGFPYNHNGSISRMLKYQLERSYQNIDFDVVNCALVGVNSYTVLDIAKGLVDYQPDAIVIYMGHNEYYGALGVASTNKLGRNRSIVKSTIYLRKLRLFQALMKFREFIIRKLNPDPAKFRNRMERMADKNVLFDSELYNAGIQQFDDNLKEILELFKKHKIPVFIGNIISNEKDQMPFESQTVEPQQNEEWLKSYQSALENLKNGEKDKAYEALIKINNMDSSYAAAQYFEGQLAYEQKNYSDAKRCFVNAKELDIVRFRAPEAINSSIKKQALNFQSHFVDIKKSYETNSPNGIIGKELVLEHLHPNIDGYYLIATDFFESLKKSNLIQSEFTENKPDKMRSQYPITPVDSIRGLYEIYMLKESWPFNEKIPDSVTSKGSYIEQIAGGLSVKQMEWNQAMAMLEEYYVKNNDKSGQLRVNEAFTLEYSFDPQFYIKAAKLSDEIGDYERSSFYYQKAFFLSPSFENAKKTFLAYLKFDKPEKSMVFIDYALTNNTGKFDMPSFKKIVLQLIDLKKNLEKNPSDKEIMKKISAKYAELGNETGVKKYNDLLGLDSKLMTKNKK